MSGPRQAAPPLAAPEPRRPAPARRVTGRTAAPSTAGAGGAGAGEPREPAALHEAPSLSQPAQLSPWQGLLAELDRLLRDPTLTRALRAFAAKVAAGARGLPGFLGDMARAVARALARIRLPRRLLLGLLALLLPLALLALLASSESDERGARNALALPAQPAGAASGGLTLPAVGMPELVAQPDEVRPVRVALVVDGTYDVPALRRELRALSGWLAENHAPGTRVAVIDAAGARASAPLGAARLADARVDRQQPSTAAAVRSALARRNGRGLVVAVGGAAPAPGAAKRLQIGTRPGPMTGSSMALARRKRARVTIDERRPNALAATVARAIMAISGERERR